MPPLGAERVGLGHKLLKLNLGHRQDMNFNPHILNNNKGEFGFIE